MAERHLALGPFYLYRTDGAGWFRLFGVGLAWKDTRKHMLLFSERHGYKRHLCIGPWSVKYLPRAKWRG